MGPQPRLQVDTRDPDEARARLSDIYCPHELTLVGGSAGFTTRQAAGGVAGLGLFELTYGAGEVRVDPVPFDDFVLITRPVRGTFAVRSHADGLVHTRRDALVMDAYGAYQLRWRDNCRVLNMVLDRRRLERIAAELRGFDEPMRVRFPLGAPVSAAAARSWYDVTRFLYARTGPGAPGDIGVLGRSELVRLAVAALLDAYPSTFTTAESASAPTAGGAAVRRAMAYIEQHAAEDIGLHDVAAAARLSPRGLQAAFQRHEQTTPLAYLRRTRLRRAHAELRASDPAGTTVTAVASRWGFVNLGRFAAEHRKQFGCAPREVLGRP